MQALLDSLQEREVSVRESTQLTNRGRLGGKEVCVDPMRRFPPQESSKIEAVFLA